MTIERIYPDDLPVLPVPLSPGVCAGGFVFASGQVASAPEGSVLVGGFTAEVKAAIDNVETILRAAGATLADVVKINAYVSTGMLFARLNEIYRERFGSALPARTTVVTSFGHPDARVELEAVAYLGSETR